MKRILSALILGAAVVFVVVSAPRFIGVLVVSAAVLAAAHEMTGLLEATGCRLNRKPILAASLLMLGCTFMWGLTGLSFSLAAGGFLVLISSPEDGTVKGAGKRAGLGILVLFFPVWCLAHGVFYLSTNEGRMGLLFLLFCVWIGDSAAYYAGTTFGRRKLAPAVSPHKTITGSVAGILGSVVTALLFRSFSLVIWPLSFVLFSGFFLSVFAQAGDLAESMIKRDAGVKDSGSLIPGHGGVLDRVDALLFTVPLFHYALSWLPGHLL